MKTLGFEENLWGKEKMGNKEHKLDFTNSSTNYEFASLTDIDLMRVVCFAVEEGTNLNGLTFTREVLVKNYRTFLDKPLILVPDMNNNPQGHAYDTMSRKFDTNARKNIGHVVNASLVIVDNNGLIHPCNDWDFPFTYENEDDYRIDPHKPLANGKLRIVVECVVYENYLQDFANQIRLLHEINELSFSMEASVDAVLQEDGTRLCTDVLFTGLAIVKDPACRIAKSIALAEKMEETEMELKELLEQEQTRNATLVAEKEALASEVETLKTEVAELATLKDEIAGIKLSLVEKSTQLADKEAEVASLVPFKEKVELAEKQELANSRAEKLSKLGVTLEDNMELAEKSKDEFASLLLDAIENYKPEVKNEISGLPVHKTGKLSSKNELLGILKVKN